ncbi:hypothetical protein HZS_3542 [Henneguya salminicola]|nr:hypothetical protein HZS_3542 [Henneguya salminicola]
MPVFTLEYVHPGKEDSLLAAEHKLFIDLLINNNFYDPHKILLNFSYINFHFERLIIYDKINETRIGFEDILEKTNDHSLLEEFISHLLYRFCIQMYDIKRAKGVLSEDCSKSIFILVELFFEMAQTDNNYSKTGIEFFLQNLDLLTHQQISNIVCKFPDNYTVKQLYPILSKSFIKYINQFHLSLAMSQNATQAASKFVR